MRVAIIENSEVTMHGQVGVALHEVAARTSIYRPFADGLLPDPGSFDALVSFGGEQSALCDDLYPYLPRLAALMADAARRNQAVLGICLGSQVMARGLGAENHIGTAPEFGWHPVTLTDAGRTDPVLRALPPDFPTFEWHSDTFTLPPGAAHLATTGVAPIQCYRHGRAAYGMQFHFEASRAVVATWTRILPDVVEGKEPGWTAALPTRAATVGAEADAHGLAIARAWVALI